MRKNRIKRIFVFILFVVVICSINLSAFVSSTIEGVVYDKETGKPIEGAEVILKAVDSTFYPLFSWETKTDKKGYFKFEIKFHLKHLKEYLQVEKEGYISYIPYVYLRYCKRDKRGKIHKLFKIKEGEIKHFKIALKSGGGIKGRFMMKEEDGIKPLKEFGFMIKRETNPLPGLLKDKEYYEIKYVETDKDGYFEAKGIEPYDNYYLEILLNGYAVRYIKKISIRKNSITEINKIFDFRDQTGIKGEVFVNRNKAENVIIVLRYLENGKKQISKEYCGCGYMNYHSNKYFCKGLKPGVYEVIAYAGVKKKRSVKKRFKINIVKGKLKVLNIYMVKKGDKK